MPGPETVYTSARGLNGRPERGALGDGGVESKERHDIPPNSTEARRSRPTDTQLGRTFLRQRHLVCGQHPLVNVLELVVLTEPARG